MTDREAKWEVEELLDRYIQCLDEERLEDWPEFFTDTAVYRIIPRENLERGYSLATMSCESKGMMMDRVAAIRNACVFSRRYLRHLVTSVRLAGREGDCYLAQANYAVLQTTQGDETKVFNAGRYADKIVFLNGTPKFQEKIVIYDSLQIPGMLVIPI
ncbi:MAG: aromatic-ring-hydroxylating dioxygenase subunit beta [Bryobacteraceae bacterium]